MFCEVEGLKVNPSGRANLDLLSSNGHEESGGGEAKETSKIHQEQVGKGGWDKRERVFFVYIHMYMLYTPGEPHVWFYRSVPSKHPPSTFGDRMVRVPYALCTKWLTTYAHLRFLSPVDF